MQSCMILNYQQKYFQFNEIKQKYFPFTRNFTVGIPLGGFSNKIADFHWKILKIYFFYMTHKIQTLNFTKIIQFHYKANELFPNFQ